MADFDIALKYTLENEGGYSDDPSDSGGVTQNGITRDEFSKWFGRSVSVAEVKNMSPDTIRKIYLAWYWKPLRLDAIDAQSTATAVFDVGVNMGIHTAVRLAQTALNSEGNALEVDGCLGPQTLQKLNGANPVQFNSALFGVVRNRYQLICDNAPSQKVFYRGWMARAERLLTLVSTSPLSVA